jgi:hypothetical protein
MFVVLVILVLLAIACGVFGAIVKGLFWLLIIGCVLFVAAVLYGVYRFGKWAGRGSKTASGP